MNKLGFIYAVGFIWFDGFAATSPSAGNANRWAAFAQQGELQNEK